MGASARLYKLGHSGYICGICIQDKESPSVKMPSRGTNKTALSLLEAVLASYDY